MASEKNQGGGMEIVLVVWSQLVVVGAAVVVVRGMRERARVAEAQSALWAERLGKVRPVVVPAPDLAPLLERVAVMADAMVREAVGAVTLVVNGPVQPERVAATAEDVLSQLDLADGSGTEGPVWVPTWETDAWVEPGQPETVDFSPNGT